VSASICEEQVDFPTEIRKAIHKGPENFFITYLITDQSSSSFISRLSGQKFEGGDSLDCTSGWNTVVEGIRL
jgi:hypothetical protein